MHITLTHMHDDTSTLMKNLGTLR